MRSATAPRHSRARGLTRSSRSEGGTRDARVASRPVPDAVGSEIFTAQRFSSKALDLH
jgi:hypothetical protein